MTRCRKEAELQPQIFSVKVEHFTVLMRVENSVENELHEQIISSLDILLTTQISVEKGSAEPRMNRHAGLFTSGNRVDVEIVESREKLGI